MKTNTTKDTKTQQPENKSTEVEKNTDATTETTESNAQADAVTAAMNSDVRPVTQTAEEIPHSDFVGIAPSSDKSESSTLHPPEAGSGGINAPPVTEAPTPTPPAPPVKTPPVDSTTLTMTARGDEEKKTNPGAFKFTFNFNVFSPDEKTHEAEEKIEVQAHTESVALAAAKAICVGKYPSKKVIYNGNFKRVAA